MLTLEGITKSFDRGKKQVLRGVSFDAAPGECIGICGTNGSGKSTLLSILAGDISADGGSIFLDGRLLSKRELPGLVSYVPQENPLIEELTARDNLKLWYSREEVSDILDIEEFIDVRVNKMSGGMKKRLSIACSVSGGGHILLLDEPTAGLDPRQIRQMREMILDLKKDHLVILSSHILSEIEEVCDHVLIISGGKLVLSDSTEHLLDEHQESLEDVFLELTEQEHEEDLEADEDTLEEDFGGEEEKETPKDADEEDRTIEEKGRESKS